MHRKIFRIIYTSNLVFILHIYFKSVTIYCHGVSLYDMYPVIFIGLMIMAVKLKTDYKIYKNCLSASYYTFYVMAGVNGSYQESCNMATHYARPALATG